MVTDFWFMLYFCFSGGFCWNDVWIIFLGMAGRQLRTKICKFLKVIQSSFYYVAILKDETTGRLLEVAVE